MRLMTTLIGLMTLVASEAAIAQPAKLPEPPRPQVSFDAASIRRQVAGLSEFKALLADPDPNLRLLTMREGIRVGDATQRQMAIEAGLASNESSMIEIALRGIIVNIQQIIIESTDAEGKVAIDENNIVLKLTVDKFDLDTGRMSGVSNCVFGDDGKWSGQFQGTVFSFNILNQHCSGTVSWSAETANFVGRIRTDVFGHRGTVTVAWKPR